MNTLPTEFTNDPELAEAWQDWLEYRSKERKEPVGPVAAKRQLRCLTKWGRDKFIQAIENSINYNWMGLFEPRDFGPAGGIVPLWRQIKAVEEEIDNHPANHESLTYDPGCSELQKQNLNNKRILLFNLRKQHNGQTSSQQS